MTAGSSQVCYRDGEAKTWAVASLVINENSEGRRAWSKFISVSEVEVSRVLSKWQGDVH